MRRLLNRDRNRGRLLKKGAAGGYRFTLEPRYDRGELTRIILRGLAVGGILTMSLAMPNLVRLLKLFEPADRRRVSKVLASLRQKRLIEVFEKNGQDFIKITEAGRSKILRLDVEEMVLNTKKRWDGVWRVVIFDIPEKFKSARLAFQIKLRDLGFYPYQKSVYVTPYHCRDEIDFLKEFFGVSRQVKYLEAAELDDEVVLLKYFNLPPPRR